MLSKEQYHQVLEGVAKLGLLASVDTVTNCPLNQTFYGLQGRVMAQGQTVTLQIILDLNFPTTLPHFFVYPPDILGFIPHVDEYGKICFADPEGMVYDQRRPVEIIREAFFKAVEILEQGLVESKRADFADEFEVHWQKQPGVSYIKSLIEPDEVAGETFIAIDKRSHEVKFIGSKRQIADYNDKPNIVKSLNFQPALFIPLKKGTHLVPPQPGKPFWTPAQVRQLLLPAISTQNITLLRALLKNSKITNEYVIFKLPRPSGGASLFGLRFEGTDNKHPFLENGPARKVYPVMPIRLDRGYLVQRGGGNRELRTKQILLIGCGAVGGYLLSQLAHAGLLHFTIIDSDLLLPENSFRHLLGRKYWCQTKVAALKTELESQLPYIQITPIANTIQEVLKKNLVRLENYDLIVVALGKPSVELELNQRIQSLEKGPPTIFTWLEPLGIGGHALLTNNPAREGCFECLYTATEEEERGVIKSNRAAFAASSQVFGRALSGCGSLHTSFGAMDAEKTALLSSRLAVDILNGKVNGNPLFSWKGKGGDFEAQGFRLADRFNFSEGFLEQHCYDYKTVYCQVCHP